MIQISNPKDCCGCTACESICPHQAISMQPDGLGFLYPVVDEKKCTNCGVCERVCPFHHETCSEDTQTMPLAFAARHKDKKEIAASQSGAAFVALSDYILEQGGVVYGVGYGEHFKAIHKRATTKEQRDEFRRSKYVQSDLNNIFKEVKKDLQAGLTVLFTGTPCQIAGLRAYLGNRLEEKLFLMDIICHGVLTPRVWHDAITYMEEKKKGKIKAVNFRDKSIKGWRSQILTFLFENNKKYIHNYLFYPEILLRKSCGNCPFTTLKRPTDITVGDYWGIENTKAAVLGEDNKGCSLILVNTPKGEIWFKQIKERMQTIPTTTSEYIKRQPNLQAPSALPPHRDAFEKDYMTYGFETTLKKYKLIGWEKIFHETKSQLAELIPSPIKQALKKILGR